MKLWRTQLDTKTFLPEGKPTAFIWIEEKVPSMLKTFHSHKRPRQNFSLQYQYNIKQAGDENREEYQSWDN